MLFPSRHEGPRPSRRLTFWAAGGNPFSMKSRVRVRVPRGCRPEALRGSPGGQKWPKCLPKGILFEVFGHRFLQNFRDSGFLREPQYLLRFNHILRVRAATFSLPGASFYSAARGVCSVAHFLPPQGRKLVPMGGPRGATGSQRVAREPPKLL